ncbi:MAG: carbohydrate porin [Succinivibrio sp.]
MFSSANAAVTPDVAFSGDASCYRAGVFSKSFQANQNDVGRLGNENDYYFELAPSVTLAEVDGTVWTGVVSFAMKSTKSGSWETGQSKNESDLRFASTQGFIKVTGLLDFDPDAEIWVGKKYIRSDTFVTDQFWRNTSGTGVGIANLSLGSGKFRANWTRRDGSNTYDSNLKTEGTQTIYVKEASGNTVIDGDSYKKVEVEAPASTTNIFDVDYNFAPISETNLDLGYTLITPQRYSSFYRDYGYVAKDNLSNGHIFTLGFGEAVLGGWNSTVLRYVTGSTVTSNGFGDYTWIDNNSSSSTYAWDLLDVGFVRFTDNMRMYFHIRGQVSSGFDKQYAGDLEKVKAFQLVVRPEYQLTKMTKIDLELGMYTMSKKHTDAKSNSNTQSQKATLAYCITPDASKGFASPEIRFFGTYRHNGHDNKSYVPFAGNYQQIVKDGTTYALTDNSSGRKSEVVFGAQAVAWF